ncbi:DegQ family serine endoprotease [Tianweitania populi]|uniref:Serine endoprotease DegQ n=1 Tax=Tianweitania populi TaxID=1607949 RepID=A0A8J3GKP1_9HYPH|nr:DegQ family serine endoprotease [Tianweitania populi]GHD08335.1 serine endoprotease DegQ [Tianweitania populi]
MDFKPRSVLVVSALMAGLGLSSLALAQEEQTGFRSLLGDLIGGGEQAEKPAPAPETAPSEPQRRVPFGRDEIQLSYAPLVQRTAPAVVNVYASRQARGVPSPFAGDPFFEQFFGRQLPPRAQSALGSGVIVDADGLIVTNNHVIKDADEIKVALADGREFESKILLKDESLDLAVLKIEGAEAFPTISVGNSEALEVGDLVLAIGNPFGVGQTTTSGIVSALARTHIGVSDFGFFVQTDAAINPGNSGGALIDMRGNLIGINTAIYSRSGGSIGIGFAIPSNIVKAVVASAKAGNDYFERPFIGATFDPVTAAVAEALGMPRPVGALVSNVYDDGPADKAGLRPGDVVVAMNGASIDSPDGLGYRLATLDIGAQATVNVLRSGKEVTVSVTLERAPESEAGEVDIKGDSPLSGAKIAELSPRLAQRLNLPITSTGVIILDVAQRSPAAQVGFRRNDIVRELNGEPVTKAADLVALTEEGGSRWRITIERDGRLIQQTLRY